MKTTFTFLFSILLSFSVFAQSSTTNEINTIQSCLEKQFKDFSTMVHLETETDIKETRLEYIKTTIEESFKTFEQITVAKMSHKEKENQEDLYNIFGISTMSIPYS